MDEAKLAEEVVKRLGGLVDDLDNWATRFEAHYERVRAELSQPSVSSTDELPERIANAVKEEMAALHKVLGVQPKPRFCPTCPELCAEAARLRSENDRLEGKIRNALVLLVRFRAANVNTKTVGDLGGALRLLRVAVGEHPESG